MDPMTIIAAINAGVAIYQAAGGTVPAKAQSALNAGATIISTATSLYGTLKDDLSATDQASVDAALQAAHDKCGADLAALIADLNAAT